MSQSTENLLSLNRLLTSGKRQKNVNVFVPAMVPVRWTAHQENLCVCVFLVAVGLCLLVCWAVAAYLCWAVAYDVCFLPLCQEKDLTQPLLPLLLCCFFPLLLFFRSSRPALTL